MLLFLSFFLGRRGGDNYPKWILHEWRDKRAALIPSLSTANTEQMNLKITIGHWINSPNGNWCDFSWGGNDWQVSIHSSPVGVDVNFQSWGSFLGGYSPLDLFFVVVGSIYLMSSNTSSGLRTVSEVFQISFCCLSETDRAVISSNRPPLWFIFSYSVAAVLLLLLLLLLLSTLYNYYLFLTLGMSDFIFIPEVVCFWVFRWFVHPLLVNTMSWEGLDWICTNLVQTFTWTQGLID